MATTVVTAKFVADITDLSAKLGAAQAQVQGFGQRMQGAGDSMVAIGRSMSAISLPLLAIGGIAVKTAMDFESSMMKMVTLVGLTREEVDGMSDGIRKMAVQYGKSGAEAADAMFFIQSAGLRGAAAMDVLESALQASRMGLGEVKTIADLTTSALNAYGEENLSATQATAHLHAAVREGKLEASELAGAMGAVLPVASAMGVSFGEVAGAMAGMSRTGTNARQATTQLRGILNSLLKPTKQAEEALEGMGLSSAGLRQQIKEKGLLSVLQTLKEQFGDNTAATAEVFGNVRALSGVLDLMGASAETNAGIIESVMNASLEEFADASEIAGETAEAKFNSAMAAMKDALIEIGQIILPIASSVVQFAASMATAFQKIPGPIQSVIVALGGVVALAGPLLWMAGGVLKGLGGLMVAFTALNTRVGLAAVSFARGMVGMALAARGAMDTIRLNFMMTGVSMKTFGALAGMTAKTVKGAFLAMGVAVRGFVAALGPVGLAIAGISTFFVILSGRSAEAEESVRSLQEALEQTGDTAKVAVLDQMIAQLQGTMATARRSAEDMFGAIGMGLDDVAIGLTGADHEFKIFVTGIRSAGEAAGLSVGEIALLVKMVERQREVFDKAGDGAGKTAQKMDLTRSAAQKLGVSVDGMSDEFSDATADANDLAKGIDKLSDMFLELDANAKAIRSAAEFRGFLREMGSAIDKNNKDLLGNSKVSDEHKKVLLDGFDKAKQEAIDWGERTGAATEDVNDRFQKNMGKVKKFAVEQGLKAKDIDTFFGKEHLNVSATRISGLFTSAIKTMARENEHVARQEFTKVGAAMSAGALEGLEGGAQRVANRARRMGGDAAAAIRQELGIQSPSKVFFGVGTDIADGLIAGMKSKDKDVKKAAEDMTRALIDKGQEIVDEWDQKLAQFKTTLDEKLAEAGSWAENLKKTLSSAFDIGAAFKAAINEEGKLDAGLWIAGVDEQIAELEWFGNILNHIRAKGGAGAKALVDYLISQGTAQGGAQGQAMIDEGLIPTMIEKMAAVEEAADAVANQMVPEFFQAGIDSAQATFDAFNERYGPGGKDRMKMERLMDRLARAMKRETTITVTTIHRTVFEAAGISGARAMGGPVQAHRAYLVGEKGPEVLVPSFAGNIIANHDLGPIASGRNLGSMTMPATMARGGDGASITNISINISAPPLTDPAEIGRQAVEAIRKYERRSGPVFASAE